jgi:hypothetical protein
MKVAIMQPYFLPYIGYFQLINSVDKFVIYDDVNFINRGWINRNNILVNGATTLIQIPLSKASQNKLINEVEIFKEGKWKVKLLRTIEQNYKIAPNFHRIFEFLQSLINKNHSHISALNFESIQTICSYLDIRTEIISSSTHYHNHHLNGQNRILDICLRENADNYINPIGGEILYDKEQFIEKNIKLNFIQPAAIPYSQTSSSFVPFLSIMDVLMNCEPEYIKTTLLKAYELI